MLGFRFLRMALALAGLSLINATLCDAERPDVAPLLASGKLGEASDALADHLRSDDDDLTRFQLGAVRFFQAVEELAQSGVRHGAMTQAGMIPFLRVGGFSGNKRDAPRVDYEDLRGTIEQFQTALKEVEKTLEPINDESLHWDLDFKRVAIDFDGDGKLARSERLDVLFRGLMNRRQQAENDKPMLVGFDSADVYWLRGYCHVLMAMADMVLAYDHDELFERTAHAFFANPRTDFAKRRAEHPKAERRGPFDWEQLSDLIAYVHLIDFKLREPDRLGDAHVHLLKVIELSRRNWELVLAEDDDHYEWIPNAKQKSVITSLAVGPEQIDAWHAFLDEAEDVLRGKKLIPFWRRGFKEGVNLERVLNDPRDFDLVLWAQGTDALPYLEEGEMSDRDTWRQFQRVFRGDFLGFAAWVN